MNRLIKITGKLLMLFMLAGGIMGHATIAVSAETTATLTVCPSGCNHSTITSAITAANAGDTIQLLMTTAHTEVNIFINKDVTIEGDPQSQTLVQAAAAPASGAGTVFTVASNQIVTMRDFTIQNGAPQFGSGGAISMSPASNVTLERMTIRNNRASNGAGINNEGGVLTLSQVSIYGNRALGAFGGSGTGGGIASTGTTYLTNVTISENQSHLGGGLFQCGGQVILANVTVTGNTSVNNSVPGSSQDGGGVYIAECSDTTTSLRSSIIAGNSVQNGVYPDCKGTFTGGSSLIENRGPLLGTRCGMSGLTSGMIYDTSPQFGDVTGVGYARSYPLSSSSPAVDTGACLSAIGAAPTADQRGAPMPVDGDGSGSAECDMGAYEYNSVPTAIHLTQNVAEHGANNQRLSLLALLLVITTVVAIRADQSKSYCRQDQAT